MGKKTPEERDAERAYSEELDRRLLQMIERYRAQRRAAGERRVADRAPASSSP